MFAIYIFKVNLLPMTIIKIGLSVFCILLCICSFLLPEKGSFSFNLDYLELLNKNPQFFIGSSSGLNNARLCRLGYDFEEINEELENQCSEKNKTINNSKEIKSQPEKILDAIVQHRTIWQIHL